MAVTPEGELLLDHFNEVASTTRLRTAAAVLATWQALPSYDRSDVAGFLRGVLPVVEGAQRWMVAAMDAYLTRYAALETGVPTPPRGLVADRHIGAAVRAGAPPSVVYERPFVTVWGEMKDGTPPDRAVAKAAHRLDGMVQQDVQLAARSAAREWMLTDDRIVGYRRVLDPPSCGLCAVAATRRYNVADLMGIHSRCGCSVEPIIGNVRPGQVIDQERLDKLKAQVGRAYSSQKALKRFRISEDGEVLTIPDDLPPIAIEEHGEVGAVLVDARHRFMTAAEAAHRPAA